MSRPERHLIRDSTDPPIRPLPAPGRVLVAGFGSLLHGDDGFGVEVVRRLETCGALPASIELMDAGTGGLHLVQRLLDGFDALVIVDAVQRGGPPGTLYLLEADVPAIEDWSDAERAALLADMHYTEPSRALALARAVGALPPRVLILGCQPAACDELAVGLSSPVAQAAAGAVATVIELFGPARARNGDEEGPCARRFRVR